MAGGVPMRPLQASLPSQSPVSQAGAHLVLVLLGLMLKLQPVRAQMRPVHDHGATTRLVWPDGR